LITDEALAVTQALRLIREGCVRAADGRQVAIAADTICVHGDGPHAVQFARRLRTEFAAADIAIRPLGD
jgi:UPF0271 protein